MSLRAILGGSRVKKKVPVKKAASTSASAKSKASSPASRSQGAGSKSRSGRGTPARPSGGYGDYGEDEDEDEDEDEGEGEGVCSAADIQDFDDDEFKLDDSGLVASIADDLSLRDVVQALRYARGNMFDPVPGLTRAGPEEPDDEYEFGSPQKRPNKTTPRSMAGGHRQKGYVGNSTRVADLVNMRRRMPPLATTAHVAALLPNATATERETVALVRAGMVRKVVQPQWRRGAASSSSSSLGGGGGPGDSPGRGAGDARYRKALAIGGESLGEVLVETAELQKLVQGSSSLGADTKAAFGQWLGGAQADPPRLAASSKEFTINSHPAPQLAVHMVDELVRAGFLVGHGASAGLVGSISLAGHGSAGERGSSFSSGKGSQSDTGNVYARPEDRTTLLSLETVAKAASGSFDAVGGVGAVYAAGGGGARGGLVERRWGAGGGVAAVEEDLMLAVPGHGMFVKLVSGALAYLVGILARTPYRETLESSLRERWDAGGNITKSTVSAGGPGAGRGRGLKRVPLSRTKKWKDFYGLSFDWVLAEALGGGLVELFDTGSVGRGVRLLS